MKNIGIIFLILIGIVLVSNAEVNEYPFEKIKQLKIGNKAGEIGLEIYPEGPATSLVFMVTAREEFIIPDPINKRINVYDSNLSYIKTITEKPEGEFHWAKYIAMDESGNIVYLNDYLGLRKLNASGEAIFTLKSQKLDLQIKNMKNLFLFDDTLFFYNDKCELEAYTKTGERVNNKRATELLRSIDNPSVRTEYRFASSLTLPESSVQVIESLRNNGKFLLVGDKLFSSEFEHHQDYYKKIGSVRAVATELRKKNGLSYKNLSQNALSKIEFNNYGMELIGYDNDHNSYWKVWDRKSTNNLRQQFVIIIDKYGETIDAFHYGVINGYDYDTKAYPTSGSIIAVAPNGDVWFMKSSKQGHDFYKVTRRW